MEKIKSLKDISWLVTEEEYRADSALSYSTLAKYERSGFNGLSNLFDKIETPSLTNGSAVDSIITGGQEEFDARFIVAEFPKISDTMITIVKKLYVEYAGNYPNLVDIPDEVVSYIAKQCDFWAGDKWDKIRAKKIKDEEGCTDYYHLMFLAKDKTILSTAAYQDVCNQINALKESDATRFYFAPDNPFEPDIERLYQLKFKATLNGIDYRCMSDEVVVDYKNKTVQPIDLKTSNSHTEWDFYKSFVDWSYQIQARLYWRIIRDNMDKDPYFKDFKLLNYKFIVVNKRTLCPLVWDCLFTTAVGKLKFGKNEQIEFRDPEVIGTELSHYLKKTPKVPSGIYTVESNNLTYWLDTL